MSDGLVDWIQSRNSLVLCICEVAIGVAAKIEGTKQQILKKKGPHLPVSNSKVGLLLVSILLERHESDKNRRR